MATYQGEWQNDMKHGKGRYAWPGDKLYHDGMWFENKREGQATATYSDGGKYEGIFKDNLRNGKGKFTYRDGSTYDGDWNNDLKHGSGIYTWPDQSRLEGSWQNGAQMEGNLIEPDGQ